LKRNNPYKIQNLIDFCSNHIEQNLTITYLDEEFYHRRALEIMREFNAYKYNYIDAISLAFIERLGGCLTFTLDENWKYFNFFKGYNLKELDILEIT
jgi:hypothetical protein